MVYAIISGPEILQSGLPAAVPMGSKRRLTYLLYPRGVQKSAVRLHREGSGMDAHGFRQR
jgi:hypothetical protein